MALCVIATFKWQSLLALLLLVVVDVVSFILFVSPGLTRAPSNLMLRTNLWNRSKQLHSCPGRVAPPAVSFSFLVSPMMIVNLNRIVVSSSVCIDLLSLLRVSTRDLAFGPLF